MLLALTACFIVNREDHMLVPSLFNMADQDSDRRIGAQQTKNILYKAIAVQQHAPVYWHHQN